MELVNSGTASGRHLSISSLRGEFVTISKANRTPMSGCEYNYSRCVQFGPVFSFAVP